MIFVELLTTAPGFSTGLIFEKDGCTIKKHAEESEAETSVLGPESVVNLQKLVEEEQSSLGMLFLCSIKLPVLNINGNC